MKSRVFTISCLLLLIFVSFTDAQTTDAAKKNPKNAGLGSRVYFPFRKKPSKEQRQKLQPRAEDTARYGQILAQPRTGIFRLLPDSGCEANTLVIKADENCLNRIPESSFYSFRENEHAQKILSDIRLENDYLISDGVYSQGILVELGDISLENVTTETAGLRFLNEFAPPISIKEARNQHARMSNGIEADGFEYKITAPVIENATYALRIVAYKGSIIKTFRGFHFDLLAGDKRIDLTLAMRVVRRGEDGGVTIVWRELARREAPRLKYERKKSR